MASSRERGIRFFWSSNEMGKTGRDVAIDQDQEAKEEDDDDDGDQCIRSPRYLIPSR